MDTHVRELQTTRTKVRIIKCVSYPVPLPLPAFQTLPGRIIVQNSGNNGLCPL